MFGPVNFFPIIKPTTALAAKKMLGRDATEEDLFKGLEKLKVLWLTGNHYQPGACATGRTTLLEHFEQTSLLDSWIPFFWGSACGAASQKQMNFHI